MTPHESAPARTASPRRAAVPHRNNFDLLRFAFAFTVVLVHAHVLTERPELALLSRWLSADFAVKAFFVVSGFLVFMSLENSASVGDYFSKRARRIYPAYFAVVTLSALGGALLSQATLAEYLPGVARYLAANLVFLNFLAPSLPGVFPGNAVTAVNGALWTLKIEVMFYLSVPIIAFLCVRLGNLRILGAAYALSVAYAIAMEYLAAQTDRAIFVELGRQLPGQLSYFVSGAACYHYVDWVRKRGPWLGVAGFVLLLLPLTGPLRTVVEPAALAALVASLAVGVRYIGNFGRYGDLSYGVYIIHFPVIQTLASIGVFDRNPYMGLGLAAAIVLAAAFASWNWIEKPFLKKSSHYVVVERAAAQT
jgi:peptidoglycan/LPS O-acetylase OafA/YrhL